ncbi:DUF2637 domain-containing protein [Rhodococcus pyridinivorans]|uniref:DUF2637 domain-containing protein n=1 Tax=Rhodococcus pyridinivorans TaxID=103816 RepID=A0A7M2XP36_9NOCA|nr:DUF2637 domain-containing protein [Rhodococcus pyridinivorans]QOV99489.1 DUF2637 domain-containing protein [Rhodococcus pyridinivorans]
MKPAQRDTLALGLAALAAVAVAGTGFWRSFTALADLAVTYGVPASQAWTLPIAVDGLVVVSTVAAVARRSARWYAWFLLVVGTVASVVGNGIHAWLISASWIGVGIAVLPPLVTLAAVHLAILLARQDRDTETPRPAAGDDTDRRRDDSHDDTPPAPVARLHVARDEDATPPVPDETRETPRPTVVGSTALGEADDLEARAVQLVLVEQLSLREAAAALGVSKDRVHRWVKPHRDEAKTPAAVMVG